MFDVVAASGIRADQVANKEFVRTRVKEVTQSLLEDFHVGIVSIAGAILINM